MKIFASSNLIDAINLVFKFNMYYSRSPKSLDLNAVKNSGCVLN